MSLQPS